MSWITLTILATLGWSVSNVIDRYVISKLIDRPIVPVIINGSAGLIASLAVFIFVGVEHVSLGNIFLAFLASVLYMLMVFFYFHAAKLEEISRIVPLFYLTPIFTLFLAAPFLGETFSPIQYFGIILLVLGAILISIRGSFLPKFGKAFWFMILATLFITGYVILLKYLLGFANFWTIFAYIRLGTFMVVIPAIVVNAKCLKSIYKTKGLKPFGLSALSESVTVLAVLIITIATSLGPVTLVNALSSVHPFFLLLLTVVISLFYPHILKEELGKTIIALKLIAIALMFVGALVVSQ